MDNDSKNDLRNKLNSSSLTPKQLGEQLYLTDRHNYAEKPVDIETFIFDKQYLGDVYGSVIFDYWVEVLKEIYPTPFYSPYYEIILSLAIGAGKTTASTIGILYDIHKLICLKNPQLYHNLAPTTKIIFPLISTTLAAASDVNWEAITEAITLSPYFKSVLEDHKGINKKHGSINAVYIAKGIGIQIGSRFTHTVGRAIFGALLDEASDQSEASDQAQKSYNSIESRMSSRFMDKYGSIPGHCWLASSPIHATDFLADKIEKSQNSKGVYIKDNVAIYEVKKELNIPEKFYIFLGDKNRDAKLIEDDLSQYNYESQLIEAVPKHNRYLRQAKSDLLLFIKETCGRRTVASAALFKSLQALTNMVVLENNIISDEILLTFGDDEDQIHNYINKDYFSNIRYPHCNRFIHLDAAFSANTADRFGIASVFCIPKDVRLVDVENALIYESQERKYFVDFAVGIKGKNGCEIQISKIEKFIYYLINTYNYPIISISADTFQSKRTLQEFAAGNIPTKNISVDSSKDPYFFFRDTVYEELCYLVKNEILQDELIHLKDNGKMINHPTAGNIITKDIADAVCGALWNCKSSNNIFNVSKILGEALGNDKYPEDYDLHLANQAIINEVFKGHF